MSGESDKLTPENKLSIESLIGVYQRPLLRYFLRQGLSASDSNDCVQEVFARVIKKDDLEGLKNPQGYIFTIASNLLKDRSRRQRTSKADKHQDSSDTPIFCERPSQDRILAGRQELELVKKAILAMPPKTQSVFVLNRFEGLKYREIADVTGMSISSVEKHMMSALKRLNTLKELL
ncbi:RNA polymerase RpoE-like sigma-24 subunit [Litorimonas taeanensis]|uniref:RNA polymerase RpoE-like sigma-24 subunit n=1 Tax=Litorimonas taeanensis TaxID=568099 RepID=A0A420WF82_9PROT|nr:RNA polymerase sigma factor [Litorimonas taeanensis]RKQ69641.1 RNA polymerase RpoE-like sigma-24 subunit [Litorimonas taeanensis]